MISAWWLLPVAIGSGCIGFFFASAMTASSILENIERSWNDEESKK